MKRILLPHQLYLPQMDLANDRITLEKKEEFLASLDERVDGKKAMVYVHVPYCDSRCLYCGFDKSRNTSKMEQFLESLIQEIDFYASTQYVQNLEVTGIHIGGGTPTYLPSKTLGNLIDYVRDQFNAQNAVLNIEGSATTLNDRIVSMLKEKNVSRVSFGVQSFNEELRKELNMGASLDDVLSTISRLKSGNLNFYIDLMYGFPNFGIEDQEKITESDVRRAIELDIGGLDVAQIYPFHNLLENRIKREGLEFPSSEEVVRTITNITNILKSAGYDQTTEYGFSKRGKNLLERSLFGGEEGIADCVALGPSSIGLLNGFRYRNTRSPVYPRRETPALLQLKRVSQSDAERIPIISFPKVLRLAKSQLTESLRQEYQEKFEELKINGLVTETDDHFELTDKGRCYVSNIQLFLMNEAEKKSAEDQLKILRLK
jgi:anaerobilin synthase